MYLLKTRIPNWISSNIDIDSNNCWIWKLKLDKDGYPTTHHINGKSTQIYRYLYELCIKQIPKELMIDHLCRVRCCVNPVHLEPVTNRENSIRGNSTKLNLEIAKDIRSLRHKMTGRDIAKKFKIGPATVSRILNNKQWVD